MSSEIGQDSVQRESYRRFWKEYLSSPSTPLRLPIDYPHPPFPSFLRETERLSLEKEMEDRLRAFCQSEKVSPFSVLLTIFQLFMFRLTGQEDIFVGASSVPLSHQDEQIQLDTCSNLLPIRTDLSDNPVSRTVLDRVKQTISRTQGFREYPTEEIWKDAQKIGWNQERFFQLLFISSGISNELEDNFSSHHCFLDEYLAKSDLALIVVKGNSSIEINLNYDSELFKSPTIQDWLDRFQIALGSFLKHPSETVSTLSLMTELEQSQLLEVWNQNQQVYPEELCVHQLFEAQVARTPDAVAVVYEGHQLTYQELNEQANHLAHCLQDMEVGPEVLVGLCVERSLEMVVGLLGILKAGGAYVPLDPSYPRERLAFMLEDSAAAVLVTQKGNMDQWVGYEGQVFCLDEETERLARASRANPCKNVGTLSLAYVIYTSGSTGIPKGTMVTHQNIARLFHSTQNQFHFGESDVWSLFHSYAFDFSVWEMWGAWLYGGRVVIVPYWVSRSPEALYDLLIQEQVTVLNQTPTAFNQLIQVDQSMSSPSKLALRFVIFGGEKLELNSLQQWIDRHGENSPQLVNMYGITETTVHVTSFPIRTTDVRTSSRSFIGRPLPDLRLYILDPYLQLVPVGVLGEMYIGGAGVTRGYLHRPELTGERFLPNPFSPDPHARLYKTGDLARRLPNGDIEYLGRADSQVKIRGFRIELGEIEAILCQAPSVHHVAVIAREDLPGDKRLVAYLVHKRDRTPSVNKLREHLAQHLPDYMIPSVFVSISALPLTSNGKIDRQALPFPDQTLGTLDSDISLPQTSIEKQLAKIWSQVLGLNSLGIDDNFFELGGDSILSIQILARAGQAGIHVTTRQLFEHPTIRKLARLASVALPARSEQGLVKGDVPLTPIQHWFFEQRFATFQHWNQSFIFTVAESLDQVTLTETFRTVIDHHDAFRLRFVSKGEAWKQLHVPPSEQVPITFHDLSEVASEAQWELIKTEAHEDLNISNGPMLQVRHCTFGENEQDRLLIVVHHLVIDGVSWRTFMEDLESVYTQLRNGGPPSLPLKTTSFKRWSAELARYANAPELAKEIPYWIQLSNRDVYPLPSDFRSPEPVSEKSMECVSCVMDRPSTQNLLKDIHGAYNTRINDVLLTALGRTFQQWKGLDSLYFHLEGHGREEIIRDVDLARTVGWFTSLFPVHLVFDHKTGGIGQALRSIKEQLRNIPQHGVGFGLLRYLHRDHSIRNALSKIARAQLLFNYLGQLDDSSISSKLFTLTTESSARNYSDRIHHSYPMEIVCQVVRGQFHVTWHYSQDLYKADTVQKLANGFISALQELIAHCQSVHVPSYTTSDFPLANIDQDTLDGLVQTESEIEDLFILSPMQQLFYSIHASNPIVGFEQWQFSIQGALEPELYAQAWTHAVNRHSLLRAGLRTEGLREPHLILRRHVRLPWEFLDWQGVAWADQESKLHHLLRLEVKTGFNLSQAPLMRLCLIRRDCDNYLLLWSAHHLQIDGWSWPLVLNDVSSAYQGLLAGKSFDQLPAPSYQQYLRWLCDRDSGNDEQFWRNELREFVTPLQLNDEATPIRSTQLKGENGRVQHDLQTDVVERLHKLSRESQVTISTVVYMAWACLLASASGQRDIVFGGSFSGRPNELLGIQDMVGPFVNNLPIRVKFLPYLTLSECLKLFQEQQLNLIQHQYSPLTRIHQWSDVPLRYRMFESLVVFQNYVIDESALHFAPGLETSVVSEPEATNYPLTVIAIPRQGIHLRLIFHRHRFQEQTAALILQDFVSMLERMVCTPFESMSVFLEKPGRWKITDFETDHVTESTPQDPPHVGVRSELERLIASAWQELVGESVVNVHDNLFDQGAHSLLLVALHGELQDKLNRPFSITKMFQYPTIKDLATFLEHAQAETNPAYTDVARRAKRQKDVLRRRRSLRKT